MSNYLNDVGLKFLFTRSVNSDGNVNDQNFGRKIAEVLLEKQVSTQTTVPEDGNESQLYAIIEGIKRSAELTMKIMADESGESENKTLAEV